MTGKPKTAEERLEAKLEKLRDFVPHSPPERVAALTEVAARHGRSLTYWDGVVYGLALSLDLLRKSRLCLAHVIKQTRDERKPQAETPSTMSINLLEYSENLQSANHMLDTLSDRGDGTIFAFFVARQGVMLAGFVWREGIPVFTFDALIPCVTNQRCFWVNLDFGCSKECQVMGCPFASGDAHNDVRRCVNQNLHF